MSLFADGVSFREPRTELRVNVAQGMDAENMHVIPARKRLDLPEPRALQTARQHDVAVQPLLSRRHLGERHAHLKRDACFLRQDAHGADRSYRRDDCVIQRAYAGVLPTEVRGERVSTTGVRLVSVGERALAETAAPEPCTASHGIRHRPLGLAIYVFAMV